MKISKRLQECANHVAPYKIVADVGTDHALLPIYLIKEGIADHVTASDVGEGPLGFAKRNVQKEGFDNINIVLSDGIKHIDDNIEVVIVSGMGGKLISDIISEDLRNVNRLILQPNMASDILRRKLQSLGFYISDEVLIRDSNIYYEVIVADRGEMKLTKQEELFGPVLLKNKDKNFVDYWTLELSKLQKTLKNIPANHENYNKIYEIIQSIQEVLWN